MNRPLLLFEAPEAIGEKSGRSSLKRRDKSVVNLRWGKSAMNLQLFFFLRSRIKDPTIWFYFVACEP